MLLITQIFFISATMVTAELYTAITNLQKVLDTEGVVINILDSYIERQEANLKELKRRSVEFKKGHELANQDFNEYLLNPVNAYLLLKRMTIDWNILENLMISLSQEVQTNLTETKKVQMFPSEEDLVGAIAALLRLKDFYGLDSISFTKGEVNGVKYSEQISTKDYFELGRYLFEKQDFYHASLWMQEAVERYVADNGTDIARWVILEYLAVSSFLQGNLLKAFQLIDELLEIIPAHNLVDIVKKQFKILKGFQKQITSHPAFKQFNAEYLNDQEVQNKYKLLCRGLMTPANEITAQLKCRYVHHNNPFLRIAPLKEEEAYLNPRIVLYRDVMDDTEIEVIKKLAKPHLRRALVENYEANDQSFTENRICESAWLEDEDDEIIVRISRRVEHMTGLSMSTAEDLQVVNYGIGGHYKSHYDYGGDDDGTGDRIATVLFYMSDVAQGGATVFPELNVTLWPEKGSAAFWFNLLPSGKGDAKTLHAACPVLVGSKWISNKWIHERGQEFLRPCNLKEENSEPLIKLPEWLF